MSTTTKGTVLAPSEDDIKKILAAQVHMGTKNCDLSMERYVWKRKPDGHFIINIGKTWDKLMLAARIIVAIDNPADVLAISGRTYGQRAVLKFAQYTGAQSIQGRYTPGTLTNQIQKGYLEPRVVIATDPRTDHQPITECSYANIPVISFASTDAPLINVDVAIPANNKGKHSIGLVYWLLAREVLRMRGTISRSQPWDVCVDLFFYRDPEEAEKAQEEAQDQAYGSQSWQAADAGAEAGAAAQQDWNQGGQDWNQGAQQDWNQGAAPAADNWGAVDASAGAAPMASQEWGGAGGEQWGSAPAAQPQQWN